MSIYPSVATATATATGAAAISSPDWLGVLSWLLGWAYFTAWSFSFYPQVIINYRRRSTKGLSLDFVVLNICGFFCYSVYTLAFYFSETVQEEYRERFGYNAPNLVQLNDVFFAVHALILSTVTLLQARWYNNSSSDGQYVNPDSESAPLLENISPDGENSAGRARPKPSEVGGLAGESETVDQFVALAAGTSIVLLIAAYTGSSMWLDLIYFLSLVKFIVSFVKYIPQAYANYNAKSTVGWSIHNILLDSTGGILSIGQLLLDSYRAGGGDGGIAGNAIKLALGLLSISFDLIFITQHYVLYTDRTDPLLEAADAERARVLRRTDSNAGEFEPLLRTFRQGDVGNSETRSTGSNVTIDTPSVLDVERHRMHRIEDHSFDRILDDNNADEQQPQTSITSTQLVASPPSQSNSP